MLSSTSTSSEINSTLQSLSLQATNHQITLFPTEVRYPTAQNRVNWSSSNPELLSSATLGEFIRYKLITNCPIRAGWFISHPRLINHEKGAWHGKEHADIDHSWSAVLIPAELLSGDRREGKYLFIWDGNAEYNFQQTPEFRLGKDASGMQRSLLEVCDKHYRIGRIFYGGPKKAKENDCVKQTFMLVDRLVKGRWKHKSFMKSFKEISR